MSLRRFPIQSVLPVFGACLIISTTTFAATNYPQPTITSFSPTTVSVGQTVTLKGSGFTGLNQAWLGSQHGVSIKVLSDSEAQIMVPAGAMSSEVAVLNPQHAAFSWGNLQISSKPVSPPPVTPPPVTTPVSTGGSTPKPTTGQQVQPSISTFTPSSGAIGRVVTITGSGFSDVNQAWIGAAHNASVKIVSDSQAQVTVPSGATAGLIVLLNAKHAVFSSSPFTVTAGGTPAPTGGTQGSGPTSGGTVGGGTVTAGGGSGSGTGTGGGTTTPTPPTAPPPAPPVSAGNGNSKLAVKVMGDHFVDANNNVLQLRGVNVSALEFTAVNSCNVADPWCGQTPNYSAIKSWDSNVIRVPLNEASWLGYTCVDGSGNSRNPDPGHNYQATVKKTVADATAAGLYVVLDLHWTAPKNFCPLAQNPMADADNSINFWSSIAGTFKGYPNVMFELFNEPYLFWLAGGQVDWQVLMQGGTETQYVTGNGAAYTANYTWKVAGMQQMLNAVRATGATNVVLVAGTNWAQDLSAWVANKPKDSLNQIGAVWHAYPNSGTLGDPQAALPKFGSIGYTWTDSVLNAGYPVFISEFGDHDAPGTKGSPFVSNLLPWADAHGASYTGWTWDVWQDADNVLIKDASGTPTDGYGAYTKQHYLCKGSGGNNCQ